MKSELVIISPSSLLPGPMLSPTVNSAFRTCESPLQGKKVSGSRETGSLFFYLFIQNVFIPSRRVSGTTGTHPALLLGMLNGTISLENSLVASCKVKAQTYHVIQQFHSSVFIQEK